MVVLHELPGITPQVSEFGRRVSKAGFRAVLPWMFGTPGKSFATGYVLRCLQSVMGRRIIRVVERSDQPDS